MFVSRAGVTQPVPLLDLPSPNIFNRKAEEEQNGWERRYYREDQEIVYSNVRIELQRHDEELSGTNHTPFPVPRTENPVLYTRRQFH